ncbi:hypothetical protein A4U49_12720 [Acidithiobacillus ferrivorans]|nr:hypothetical protein A4U49_12720 [Acidithiobacillus ferrivorans]
MFRQQRIIFASVALGRGDEANAAVTMFMVVPGNKIPHPYSGSIKARKAALWPLWTVLRCPEQRRDQASVAQAQSDLARYLRLEVQNSLPNSR